MRKVIIKINPIAKTIEERKAESKEESKQLYKYTVIEGKFHQWGITSEEHETNFGNYTVAIVEDDKGFIHSVLPDFIQFIN